jgi:uncharacterized membrane protein
MSLILLAAAVVVSVLVFGFLLKVVRAAIGTAIMIALVVLLLQIVFGIGFDDLWQQVIGLWQNLWQSIFNR